MGVTAFTFDRAHAESFIQFGYEHYAGVPGWIPPIRAWMRAQMAPENQFYGRPGNHHRHFLCAAGARVVGRVSAFVNADLHDSDGLPIGAVGFYEAIEDDGVSRELLDAAAGWLTSQHGIHRIWGPLNFDIWHGYRFMTRGFEHERFFGEPGNHRWYPEQFTRYGFTVRQSWATREVHGREAIAGMVRSGEETTRAFEGRGYRFRPIDVSRLSEGLATLHDLTTRSFAAFLGFTPIGREEFEGLFALTRHGIIPELIQFALDPEGHPVGFVAAFPDLTRAVRAMRGGHGPLARLRFQLAPRSPRRVILFFGGALPGASRERAGLGRAGVHVLARQATALGCDHFIEALVASGNPSAALLGEHRTAVTREYELYELKR